MKKSLLSALIALIAVPSFAQEIDIHVSDGRSTFVVRGSGGWVCSAKDAFKEIPVLGRGNTRAAAEANAKYAASVRAGRGGDMFFSRTLSCEPSASGRGRISMSSTESGTKIHVEGPSAHQCISSSTFRNIPFIAEASTLTEASALAGSACAADAGDSGFFCRTHCEKLSTGSGAVVIGKGKIRIRLPGLRL